MSGFIKLNRDIEGTWIHEDDRYFKAWCTILLNVNWKPANVVIGSKNLFCDVNEALFSLDTWAKKFGKSWNKDKVRRFFNRLETHHYISTKSATKTTRLKVLVSSDCEDEPHDKDTNTDTKMARTPHPIEELRIKELIKSKLTEPLKQSFEEFLKMRKQIKKPLKTSRAIQTKINRLQKYLDEHGEQKTLACITLSLDNEWQDIKMEWLERELKTKQAPKSDNNESHDLESYLAENMHHVELRKMKESGKLDQLKEKLKENQFKLSNIAKAYKNEMITTLFLFEALFLPLGNRLGGSNDKRKLESFQKWVKTLSDYNQNKGDIRQLLKDRNKNLV